jgi:hypothetical protein
MALRPGYGGHRSLLFVCGASVVQKQQVTDWSEYARRAASVLADGSGRDGPAEVPDGDLTSIRADKVAKSGDNAIS